MLCIDLLSPDNRSMYAFFGQQFIGVLVLVVSGVGYLGAGLYALQADPIDWIYVGIVYGGPVLLVGLGLLLRAWSLR